MTRKFYINFTCRKCEGNIGEAVEQEVMSCDEVVTVREITHHGDRVSAGGGCEAAVTASRRCGWVKFRVCSELLYNRKFLLKLKMAVYYSYVMPTILYGSEAWCLNERWEFYDGQRDPWLEQCVEYSSKKQKKDLWILCSC